MIMTISRHGKNSVLCSLCVWRLFVTSLCLTLVFYASPYFFKFLDYSDPSPEPKPAPANFLPNPYTYKRFQIIVLTYNREVSLQRLLESLNHAYYDGEEVIVNIWIDRSEKGEIHEPTYTKAKEFDFKHGTVRIHNQTNHVGIIGQWIETWVPEEGCQDIALFLEDDISVSPYFYRYLRAVHRKYHHLSFINGFALNGERTKQNGDPGNVQAPRQYSVFSYPVLSTWGFSPKNDNWRSFIFWYRNVSRDKTFDPVVPGTLPEKWYRTFKAAGRAHTVWSVWHVYYSWKTRERTVYPNTFNGLGFVVNWKEKGLHFFGNHDDATIKEKLISQWDSRYDNLPEEPVHLKLNGKIGSRDSYA